MNLKKILASLSLSGLVLSSTAIAATMPQNSIVIGNEGFPIDFFFEDVMRTEVINAIASGGDIYIDLEGQEVMNAWTESVISEEERNKLGTITYYNSDGTTTIYEGIKASDSFEVIDIN